MLHGLAKRKSPRLMAAVSMAPSRNLRSLRCLWARRGWLVWTTTEAHDVHVTPKIPWDPNAKDLGFLSNDGRIHPSIPFLGDTWHFFPHPIASFSAPNPPKLFGPICSHWKSEWWRQPCFSSELPFSKSIHLWATNCISFRWRITVVKNGFGWAAKLPSKPSHGKFQGFSLYN